MKIPEVRYDYFHQRQDKLVKSFSKFCRKIDKKLTFAYNKDFAGEITSRAIEEYREMIPRIPYYGGGINPIGANLRESVGHREVLD